MEEIKCCCGNCVYMCGYFAEQKEVECGIPYNESAIKHKDISGSDDYHWYVKRDNYSDEIPCEHFVPECANVELVEYSAYNATGICPYCGYENTFYDVGLEGSETFQCENCGKTISMDWCKY